MTIYNMGNGGRLGNGYSHPLHIHGTHFYLMKIGYPEYYPENMTIKSMNPDIPCLNTTVILFYIFNHTSLFRDNALIYIGRILLGRVEMLRE
jgi:hypothetical protein